MKKRKLLEYSPLLCIKINVVTALLLVLLFSCAKFMMEKVEREALATVEALDNGAGALLALVFIGAVVGIVLICYTIVVPCVMPFFRHVSDNFKSLVGLTIGNFSIAVFLFSHFTLQLALCYFFCACIGMCGSVYLRYNRVRLHVKIPK